MKENPTKKDNKEYIKDLFDSDGIEAPESLSEDNIMSMLQDKPYEAADEESRFKSAKVKKHPVLKWAAVAACAVIALISAPSLYYSSLFMPDTSARDGELYTFKNRNELKHIINSFNRASVLDNFRLKSSGNDMIYETEDYASSDTGVAAEESSMATGSSDAAAAPGSSNHSSTYLQVDEVDEADIIKTDGKYIYYVTHKQEVIILEAADGKAKKIATIGSNGIENYIQDIYLKGDTLVTIGSVYDDRENYYIAVVSYDISDRSHPTLRSEFRQSGNHVVSSRMVGNYVYLVTDAYAYGDSYVPKCTIDGEYREMSYSDIACVPNPKSASYIILSAVDISSDDVGRSKTKAVLGASSDVYCNDRNLYTVVSEWDEKNNSQQTRIVRASLDGLDVKFDGTATVKGYVNNQFSMDEHDGYFRIATTSNRSGMDVNNLYVLDSNLSEVGKISGFARDESIKAVRFMGDKAYVITYEAIDPLFIMDLSDPTDPHIEGEVKIDGFSSLLVPISSGRLLGIGYATGDNGYGGQYASGLKLALFDISDPTQPKVIDSKEFKDMSSPAQATHLALNVNNKDGYYAIPYSIWNNETVEMIEDTADAEAAEPKYESGVLVFTANDKLGVKDQHKLAETALSRCVYIDEYIYALDEVGEPYSFRIN